MLRITALVMVLLLGSTMVAAASDEPKWSRGFQTDGYLPYAEPSGSACIIRVRLWVQAHAGSEITQLQMRYQLRGPFDPGIPFTHYGDTGWIGSGFFEADSHYYTWFHGWFRQPSGGQYKVRAMYRGVRDGWWNRDLRHEEDLEPLVGCGAGYLPGA